jgi:AcrR family transcriptional regulator
MKKSAPLEPKKRPQQRRSKATVEYILEAAAQILSQDGPRGLNTNGIARRAGVAVASLYQYFPNKEAIVHALFELDLSEERAELATRRNELQDEPFAKAIRVGVRSMIDLHARKPRLVTSILQSIPFLGGAEALVRARQQVVDLVCDAMKRRPGELRSAENLEIKAFLVVHAVESVIHDAASERPSYLTDPAFAQELVEMLERFLLAPDDRM